MARTVSWNVKQEIIFNALNTVILFLPQEAIVLVIISCYLPGMWPRDSEYYSDDRLVVTEFLHHYNRIFWVKLYLDLHPANQMQN